MASENKIQEYMDSLEQEKIMIETHFANIERILKDNPKLDQEKAFGLLSNFNTLSIQYDQLCNDLIKFINIFKGKGEQEIRLYKTDELVELLEAKINNLNDSLVEGSFRPADWEEDAPAPLVLGTELAANLNAFVGDEVVLIPPQSISTGAGMFPKMKRFRISGLLRTGYYEFDNTIAYAPLADASDFLGLKQGITGIAVKLKDMNKAEAVAPAIEEAVGYGYAVRTFAQMNSTLYAALKLEKAVMFIILFLIILVASLNIASNLILLGTEKLRDIGIMRALGASPKMIRGIFIWEAMMTATVGIVLGVGLALLLCWVIATFNIVELPGDIYYLTKVPVRIQMMDVLAVIIGSYLVCFLAGLYPAVKASRVNPTDAIRYG